MIHICFVTPHAFPILSRSNKIKFAGGAEVQQCIISKALIKVGHKVSMVCLDYGQEDRCVIAGVTVFKAHKPDGGIPVLRFFHPRLSYLWRAMHKANADIYYQRCAGMHTGLVASFCIYHNKKFIYAASSNSNFLKGQQRIKLKRDLLWYEWGLKKADTIIVQNMDQMRLLEMNYGVESVLIHSCYEDTLNQFPKMKCNKKNILWVSTMSECKRPEMFIHLAKSQPSYNFIMVGGPGEEKREKVFFCRLLKESEHIPNLELVGFVPFTMIDKYFDDACLFVNTSTQEGFPNTFLQAWSRGIPTISFFDTGSRSEGKPVGVIVNSVEELSKAIENLITCDRIYSQISSRCLQYFKENHSVKSTVKQYGKVLDNLTLEPC